jgi:hypothetical protein
MMKTFIAIAAVAMLASSSTWADDFPFVGKWNCGVAEFTFTNLTAYNGSETYPILKVEKATQSGFRSEKGAMSYRLEFQKRLCVFVAKYQGQDHDVAFACQRRHVQLQAQGWDKKMRFWAFRSANIKRPCAPGNFSRSRGLEPAPAIMATVRAAPRLARSREGARRTHDARRRGLRDRQSLGDRPA